MELAHPSDLPPELERRYALIAERLAELDVVLPPRREPELPRVVLASDFVLRVLNRWPEMLVERLGDEHPLEATAVDARLALAGLTEAQAMTVLRRNAA